MPEFFDVISSAGLYQIAISRGQMTVAGSPEVNKLLIVDRHVSEVFGIQSANALIVEASEDAKSLEAMGSYVAQMRRLGASRKTQVIAIGGGTVQDVSTFLCSIYMRGLKWSYMPTTLLAMVDSCIGGKSAINAGGYKNLVGNFFPPQAIEIDLDLIESMSATMRAEGMVEAAKICFARGSSCFADYISRDIQVGSASDEIGAIVALSLKAKKWFVEVDEFDQSERLLLNFGHTFGHAIEAASDFKISHGIAVGLGILVACEVSRQVHQTAAEAADIGRLCQHIRQLLSAVPELHQKVGCIGSTGLLMQHFGSDKKHDHEVYRIIIPNAAGVLSIRELPRAPSSTDLLASVTAGVLKEFGFQAS
jgi:3-dehydroquinate synthase